MQGPAKDRLRAWRKANGLSQEDFAKLVACSQQTVSNIEGGSRSPWLSLALNIERVTGGKIAARLWPPTERRGRAA